MKFIFSLLVAVIVGSLSCSAADFDSSDYYSLSPVQSLSPTVNSALDYGVSTLSLTSNESTWLQGIWQSLTQSSSLNGGNVIYLLRSIEDAVTSTSDSDNIQAIRDALYLNKSAVSGSVIESVRDITTIRDALIGPSGSLSQPSTHSIFSYIYNLSQLPEIKSDTQYIEDLVRSLFNVLGNSYGVGVNSYRYGDFTIGEHLAMIGASLNIYGTNDQLGVTTLYTFVRDLKTVLASDDDITLANSQKANREEIESEFLSGSSGSTSLGVSDFGDLAHVGGTLKDSLSLDGNATIGSFTSGLTAADTAGQGWFSETTRSQLDAVSSTVTYSLRDPDPYNMSGWEARYYWLLGDDAS